MSFYNSLDKVRMEGAISMLNDGQYNKIEAR